MWSCLWSCYTNISVEDYKLLLKYFCVYDCKNKKYFKNVNYFRHLVAKTRWQLLEIKLEFWRWLWKRRASLVDHLVKNPPAMQETWVWSLGWEDPLEKGKATHSSILAWRIPWTVHGVAKHRTQLSVFRRWKRRNAWILLCKSQLIPENSTGRGTQRTSQ